MCTCALYRNGVKMIALTKYNVNFYWLLLWYMYMIACTCVTITYTLVFIDLPSRVEFLPAETLGDFKLGSVCINWTHSSADLEIKHYIIELLGYSSYVTSNKSVVHQLPHGSYTVRVTAVDVCDGMGESNTMPSFDIKATEGMYNVHCTYNVIQSF